MSELTINGHDIEPYLPAKMSDAKKSDIHQLTLSIIDAVELQLPIGFSYNNNPRLVLPHSVFLQNKTPSTVSEVRRPSHIHTRMKFYKNGARRAIGMDANQIFSKSEESRNGWKTFHMDKIDDTRIMAPEEIGSVFQLSDDRIDDDIHITEGFTTTRDFVRNWNHWFRVFLKQAPSKLEL